MSELSGIYRLLQDTNELLLRIARSLEILADNRQQEEDNNNEEWQRQQDEKNQDDLHF